jgi:hypothetical protein
LYFVQYDSFYRDKELSVSLCVFRAPLHLLWDASLIGFIYDNRDNGRLRGPGLGWSSQEAQPYTDGNFYNVVGICNIIPGV